MPYEPPAPSQIERNLALLLKRSHFLHEEVRANKSARRISSLAVCMPRCGKNDHFESSGQGDEVVLIGLIDFASLVKPVLLVVFCDQPRDQREVARPV